MKELEASIYRRKNEDGKEGGRTVLEGLFGHFISLIFVPYNWWFYLVVTL